MTELSLLGALPTFVGNWLTPIWILSVGALAGLVILLVVWGVAFALSRIVAIGRLAEDAKKRTVAIPAFSALAFLALLAVVLPRVAAREAGNDTESMAIAALILVPIALLIGLALVWFTSRRTVAEVPQAVREGPLWWIFIVTVTLSVFAFVGLAIAMQPQEILRSVLRLPASGDRTLSFTIPATSADVLEDESRAPEQHEVNVNINTDELYAFQLTSDQTITVDTQSGDAIDLEPLFEAAPGNDYTWVRQQNQGTPFDVDQVKSFYIRNYGLEDAHLKLKLHVRPKHPEASLIPMTAFSVVAVFLLYILQRSAMPKMSAIALATIKSEMAQPLFLIIMLLGVFALVAFVYIPYNTFGEDIKMLKDSSMVLIKVLCIIQAVWAASTSVSEEIEGRTALTVLSKPLRRRSFVLGKYLGIFWTVAVIFIVLGVFLMLVVAYKPIYDARETSQEEPIWQVCYFEMAGVVPGLVLGFMETAILAAISVAISTRLPMLANFIICFAIYVIGHLTPLLVQVSVGGGMFEAVVFVAQLLSTVFPVLDHFSIEAAVAGGAPVPYDYLGWALLYTLIYGMIALLLALVLFEDRDLA